MQKIYPEVLCKKAVLKNFAKSQENTSITEVIEVFSYRSGLRQFLVTGSPLNMMVNEALYSDVS